MYLESIGGDAETVRRRASRARPTEVRLALQRPASDRTCEGRSGSHRTARLLAQGPALPAGDPGRPFGSGAAVSLSNADFGRGSDGGRGPCARIAPALRPVLLARSVMPAADGAVRLTVGPARLRFALLLAGQPLEPTVAALAARADG